MTWEIDSTHSRVSFAIRVMSVTTTRGSFNTVRGQLHIDEQRTPPVEHRRSHLRGNAELDSRELAASLLSPKSAACVVVAVHMLSTSGHHSPITTLLCPGFQMRNSTEGVHIGCVAVWRACSWTAGQVRSTQARSF